MIQRVVVIALCAAAVACAFELPFVPRNWTELKPIDAEWRRIGEKPLATRLTKGSWFYSLSAEAAAHVHRDVFDAQAHVGAEAIIALAAVSTDSITPTVPVTAYAFFDADALATAGLNLNDLAHARAQVAVGAVAMVYEGLVEVDSEGN
eukprot:m51a1_g9613 hypothetical protein (149) ;mRNA; r:1080627-1081175